MDARAPRNRRISALREVREVGEFGEEGAAGSAEADPALVDATGRDHAAADRGPQDSYEQRESRPSTHARLAPRVVEDRFELRALEPHQFAALVFGAEARLLAQAGEEIRIP